MALAQQNYQEWIISAPDTSIVMYLVPLCQQNTCTLNNFGQYAAKWVIVERFNEVFVGG